MESVDTFYEYLGYALAEGISQTLRDLWIPLLVALCGAIHATVRSSEEGRPHLLIVYLLTVSFAAWLVGPMTLSTPDPEAEREIERNVPRILHYGTVAADQFVGASMKRINRDFWNAPFEWERMARMISLARINEPGLREQYQAYLSSCYAPLVARQEADTPDPLSPEISQEYLDSDALVQGETLEPCRTAATRLRSELADHLFRDPHHRQVIDAAYRVNAGENFLESYLRTVSISEWRMPDPEETEQQRVAQSLGEFHSYERAGSGFWANIRAGLGWVGSVQQSWASAQEPRQQYYLVTLYGPHIYGFTLMILMGLFPIVGCVALAPSGWKALLNFGKVFFSVKLWPLVWSAISLSRGSFDLMDGLSETSAALSMEDVWIASISMYLLTPCLTFLLVQLGTRAASVSMGRAIPGATGSVSPLVVRTLTAVGGGGRKPAS